MIGKNKKRKRKTGLPPGTPVYTGEYLAGSPDITAIRYNAERITEQNADNPTLATAIMPPRGISWYDVRGLSDVQAVEKLAQQFKIHPLALEDILDVHQRPKWEEYDSGIFITTRALSFDDTALEVKTEQIGIFLGNDFVISFQEDSNDLFPTIRERLHRQKGRIRQRGADYLAYSLLDHIVDQYYLVLDKIDEAIDEFEQAVLTDAERADKRQVYHLKRQLTEIRRTVAPMREAVNKFILTDSSFIRPPTVIFARDLHDHILQISDIIENQRDTLSSLFDLYHSELGQKANHVMKTLTIVSTIFIPLTFIAGVYGTNFEHLPELHWKYAYYAMWGIMTVIAIGLLVYFKIKKWL
jgi:magnesium transporter